MSFSEVLLLIYRKAVGFFTLILYPETFLYLFIVSNSFFGRVFRDFYIQSDVMCKE